MQREATMTRAAPPINQLLIARRLKLSAPTVSRALRNTPGINPRTRERVLSLAAELGYELPLSPAAPAAPGRFLCLLTRAHPSGRQSLLFHAGLSQAASLRGASLVMHQVAEETLGRIVEPEFQPAAMRSGLVDGIILQYRWPVEVVRELSARWPCVSINHATPGVDHDLVTSDEQEGMMTLVGHLHALGHRHVGYFGFAAELTWSARRYCATLAACLRLRLPEPPVIPVATALLEAFPGDWSAATAQACARREVTAWICPSGYAADRLHAAFLAQGLQVPKHRSIAVYDAHDATAADYTALVQSNDVIGATAVERLLERIARPRSPTMTIAVRGAFHAGATTGPAAGHRPDGHGPGSVQAHKHKDPR
jgi:DNA-binding LacI/PurR family transcriptional regulator